MDERAENSAQSISKIIMKHNFDFVHKHVCMRIEQKKLSENNNNKSG